MDAATPMQAISDCGWPAWVTLLGSLAALLVAATALALAVRRKRTAPIMALLALSFGIAPYGCGTFGEQVGRWQVDALLSGAAIDPAQHDRIRNAGYAEAAMCRTVGTASSVLPASLAALALALAFLRRDPGAAPIIPPRDPR